MSGPIGIGGIDSGVQPNAVVGNTHVENGIPPSGVGGAQPDAQGDVHAVEDKSHMPGELSREFDILLSKAASRVRAGENDGMVMAAVRRTNISPERQGDVWRAMERAKETMKRLDGLTGEQLADAMVRKKSKDGVIVEWKTKNQAYEAVDAARKAQQELSSILRAVIDSLPADANEAIYCELEEAMFQADRRWSEIETIVMQVSDIASRGRVQEEGGKGVEDRLDRSLGEIAVEKSTVMHDNDRALTSFRRYFDPIAKRIAEFSADTTRTADVSAETLNSLVLDLYEARCMIGEISKNGVVKVETGEVMVNGKKAKVDVVVDRAFIDTVSRIVDDAWVKLSTMRQSVARGIALRLVNREMPSYDEPFLQPKVLKEMEDHLHLGMYDTIEMLEEYESLRDAMRDFVLASAKEGEKALDKRASDLRRMSEQLGTSPLVRQATMEIENGGLEKAVPGKDSPEVVRNACKRLDSLCRSDKNYLNNLVDKLRKQMRGLGAAVEHLIQVTKNAKKLDEGAFRTTGALLGLYNGGLSFTSLVESRIHGYDDGDVDSSLDDVNVDKEEELGKGGFNTVTLLTYKDGREYVFKPEMQGRMQVAGSKLLSRMNKGQHLSRINGAVQKTADMLGLGDVMVKTTVGTHNGLFGMFMEKAPGFTAEDFCHNKEMKLNGTLPILQKVRNLKKSEHEKVVGDLMRQSNRLQWFDLITAQGDRHTSNYMVDIDSNRKVTVKGIDNDASFGVVRTGLQKFHLTGKAFMSFVSNLTDTIIGCFPGRAAKEEMDKLIAQLGMKDGETELTVDLSKVDNPCVVHAIRRATGIISLGAPQEIDSDLFERLVELKEGEARKQYIDELKERLGEDSEEYKCALARLDDVIAHAEKLSAEKRVYTAEQWERQEVQRAVASRQPEPPVLDDLGGSHLSEPFEKSRKIVNCIYLFEMSGNFFLRDLAEIGLRPGWLARAAPR